MTPDESPEVKPRSAEPGGTGNGGPPPADDADRPREVRPPSKSRRRERKPSSSGSKGMTAPQLERELTKVLTLPAVPMGLAGDVYCATVIGKGMPDVAHELVELGKVYPAVRYWLEWLAKPGVFGGLAFALANVAVPVAVHHGALPRGLLEVLVALGASDVELPPEHQGRRFVAPREGPAEAEPPEPVPVEHTAAGEVPGMAGPFAGMHGPEAGQALEAMGSGGPDLPAPSIPEEGADVMPSHDQPPS